MASIKPHKQGYRVQVYVKGDRDSAIFRTLREANAWASARETELRTNQTKLPKDKHTLKELLEKYRDEVSIKKRGFRLEIVRINKFLKADSHLPINQSL